jgi:hypothetical protein
VTYGDKGLTSRFRGDIWRQIGPARLSVADMSATLDRGAAFA